MFGLGRPPTKFYQSLRSVWIVKVISWIDGNSTKKVNGFSKLLKILKFNV